jgi:DNA-directed RNA polymerase subunit beta
MIRQGLRNSTFQEFGDKEVDYEFHSPNSFFGSHVNLIPIQNAVQGPRLFYGARFYNQAMPLSEPEAPLVQNVIDGDEDGRSFDEYYGKQAGAVRADTEGTVTKVTPDKIFYKTNEGEKRSVDLYNKFPFNRKTLLHNTPMVNPGDTITPGQLLAKSNYTDDNGTLALGANARVAVVPYKGYSLDDSAVISAKFAKKLSSEHATTYAQDFDNTIKKGKGHFSSLFPTAYSKEKLEILDDDGIVKPGTILNEGDPIILATRPKVISSSSAQVGKLSKVMRASRSDASQVWEHEEPGEVVDVANTKNGTKVIIQYKSPAKIGDKIVFRSGQKGVISKIIEDDHMPRGTDGNPFDILLNPLSIPSRVNNSIIYELLLGKVAAKNGQPYKIRGFNQKGEKWYDFVLDELNKNGITDTEQVFDPTSNKLLENPVTTGNGFVLKLHHVAESKYSARGQGGYDANQQPVKGGDEGSKRLSGLETHGLLSAGAYHTLREGGTIKGQKNDEWWRTLKSGRTPMTPGEPFVWHKFRALLGGAGFNTKDVGKGEIRLGPYTDKDLDDQKPMDIKNGEMVDMNTLEPKAGGLFDSALVGNNKWGRIKLPFAVPNPAFEDSVRKLLGLTEKEFRAILAGKQELPEHLQK